MSIDSPLRMTSTVAQSSSTSRIPRIRVAPPTRWSSATYAVFVFQPMSTSPASTASTRLS